VVVADISKFRLADAGCGCRVVDESGILRERRSQGSRRRGVLERAKSRLAFFLSVSSNESIGDDVCPDRISSQPGRNKLRPYRRYSGARISADVGA